jgi:peptidoglycan/xylan/chitin deacetylase (PgdA/CDA1 family)
VRTPINAAPPSATFRLYLWVTVVSKVALVWLWPHHPLLSLAVFAAPELWLALNTVVPNASGLGPVARRFAAQGREVCLTIDDGPDPQTTPALLDLLESHQAKAVFFLIGVKAARHPDLVRMIAGRGHELGNHTHTHPLAFFWCAGPGRTAREIDACSDAIEAAAGLRPRFFRSPAGIKSVFMFGALARRGLAYVGWSGRGLEHWSSSPEAPLGRLVRKVEPGAILLTHESGSNSRIRTEVVAGLLGHLSREGYRCVLPPAA